jgi:rare lipoprotein A
VPRARSARSALALASLALVAACASRPPSLGEGGPYKASTLRPYEVGGETYRPAIVSHYEQVGLASWYDYPNHTRRTAVGDWFDGGALTGAHRTLPLPCLVEVTNLENGRSIKVRVNDRGPFAPGRIIDLSRAAADELGFSRKGVAKVRVRFLGPAEGPDLIGMAAVAPADG